MAGLAGMSSRDTEVRLPRATKVKNKQAADRQVNLLHLPLSFVNLLQLTCDQILGEAVLPAYQKLFKVFCC